MNNDKIAEELTKLARSVGSSDVEEYDVETEMKYNKMYQSMLGGLMKNPHLTYQIESAKRVYDKKKFINDSGVTYTFKVNTNAKKDVDIITAIGEKDGKKEKKNISPANVPFMLG